MKSFTTSAKKIIKIVAPVIFWLGLWALVSSLVNQVLFIPSPMDVLERLMELVTKAYFWRYTGMSLLRIFCGAAAGIIVGIAAAAATFAFVSADVLLSPAIRIIRTVPVVSSILLILLWVKTGLVPVVISALMVFPVMWECVSSGLRSADPQLLELARSYRMGRWKTVRYVYFPAVRPHLASGILTSIGLAWKSGVAAEVLCIPRAGIGREVYFSKLYLETPSLFAWSIVVIILSLALESLARWVLGVRKGADESADDRR